MAMASESRGVRLMVKADQTPPLCPVVPPANFIVPYTAAKVFYE